MRLFFDPSIETTGALEESEAHHAIKVLRLKQGDTIQVIDGKGHLFICSISTLTKKDCTVQIIQKQYFEPSNNCKDIIN